MLLRGDFNIFISENYRSQSYQLIDYREVWKPRISLKLYIFLHLTNRECRLCSNTHRTFENTDHILNHEESFNKIQRHRGDHIPVQNAIKLEIYK